MADESPPQRARGRRLLELGVRSRESGVGSRELGAGHTELIRALMLRLLECPPEAGSWESGVGSWELELGVGVGSWESGRELGVGSWEQ